MRNMAADQDWKSKYFESLRELEDLERNWDKQEELLRRAVSRLTITAKGLNPRLDSLLATIQQHCKKKKDDMLASDLDKLSQVLNQVDSPAASGEDYQWSEFAFDLSRRVEVPDNYQGELNQLKSQLPQLDAGQALSSMADLINRLIRLDHSSPDSVDASELLDELIERVASTFGSNEALERIRGDIAQVEGELDWRQYLDQIIQQLRQLIKDINQEKVKLENLIVDVNQQLKDISNLLLEEHEDHIQGRRETLRLRSSMDQSVEAMQNEIKQGTEIDQLKSVLGQNLNTIKHSLKEFVESDNLRFEHAEQRNQHLQDRLSQMEQESSELRRQLLDNRKKLMYDTLTGVRSRLSYDEVMEQEFARYARYQETFSYALLDIDHFKRINDTYGHHTGDNALRIVSSMMLKHIRKTDFLFRIGGEEFALLLPKTTLELAAPVVESIRKSVGESVFHYKGEPVTISMSAGLTEVGQQDDITTIYERGDKALYAAKNSGRDRMVAIRGE
jgi:diguanylate cyclase